MSTIPGNIPVRSTPLTSVGRGLFSASSAAGKSNVTAPGASAAGTSPANVRNADTFVAGPVGCLSASTPRCLMWPSRRGQPRTCRGQVAANDELFSSGSAFSAPQAKGWHLRSVSLRATKDLSGHLHEEPQWS